MKLTPRPFTVLAMTHVGLPAFGAARQGVGEFGEVVAVDGAHVPAERAKFLVERLVAAHVAGVAGDLQRVVVEDRGEVVELVMGGGHRGFPVRTLGQFAVAQQREHAIRRGIHLAGQRHADADRQAVAQRAGVHLDARNFARRMADERRLVAAERFQLRPSGKNPRSASTTYSASTEWPLLWT